MTAVIIKTTLLFTGLAGMTGTTAWVLRKGNNNRQTKLFTACQFSIVLWLISQLLILFSESDRQLTISYLIGNTGICFFAPLWLLFSAEFAKSGPLTNKKVNYVLLISVISLAITISNPIHHLYYSEFGMNGIKRGILFYVLQAVYYNCLVISIILMLFKLNNESNKNKRQILLLILSTGVPLIVNTLTLTGIINAGIELTPLFFSFSSIMVIIAFSRYGLLNINRIAITDAVDHIENGILVFGNDGELTYCNKTIRNKTDIQFGNYSEFANIITKYSENEYKNKDKIQNIKINDRYYSIQQNLIDNQSGNIIARVIIISDITEFHNLADTERKLSIEQERNRIAQEIHDSAGHTFTMISSLARLLSVEKENVSEIEKYIYEIDGLSRSGITQLRCSINNLRNDEFLSTVESAVRTVAEAVRGIKIELFVQGTEDSSFKFCIRTIYDNVRELVTNSMRYSSADRIDIILKFLKDHIELYVFDNGKGCSVINENNGLRGIRERTESLGGTVKFTSVENEGFNTVIKIPVKEINE